MDFTVKRNSPFKELFIRDGHITIETGLLNDAEMKELAAKLREAADDLWELEDEE